MRIFFLSIIIFLPLGFLKAQYNAESLTKKLKVNEGLIKRGDKQYGIVQYDINGNLIYDKYDNFAGSTYLSVSSIRTYNQDQKLSKNRSTHSSFPNDTTVWNYQYDANKNLVFIRDDKGHTIFEYVYDTLNRKIKELSPDYEEKFNSEETFSYDEKGNQIEETRKMGSFPIRTNKSYYDSYNKLIKSESIENNKTRFADSLLYDPTTHLLIKEIFNEDGNGTVIDGLNYKYDDRSRLTARMHFDLNNGREKIIGEEHFEYFDNGLIKKYSENIFTDNHITRTFTYSYKFYFDK